MKIAACKLYLFAGLTALLLSGPGTPVRAAPTTLSPILGSALLCRGEIDSVYFMQYLSQAFGPPVRHEGGAWWFKADGNLWGATITEVMVSDDSSAMVFVAAVAETTPEAWEEGIRAGVGVAFRKIESGAFPLRETQAGTRLAYALNKAKLYCAKFKPRRA
ncbi:hypothetical protein [Massilia sp. TS11]|uniref:hypothetical protein n=1 Tax=Massilia sp. TS11 TaxID=2908003 RepID=UPI001ED9E3D5|nr:hypothetical protein [Massilia sp. TS11]MCG2585654.1 hypothetical protein [Massilia sp. TS11]